MLLVGGGSVLVDRDIPLKGASKVITPSQHWVKSNQLFVCFYLLALNASVCGCC